MKILMLVNWKVECCESVPIDRQPPDYYIKGADYWFYRYFKDKPDVDIIDTSSFLWLESFEKNTLRFYIIQALKAIPKLNQYDLIVSHGMQSGVVISLWRRLWKGNIKHIVFDIGSFASASESGFALKLMRFASKSIDKIIYHTSSQIEYYKKFFPWIIEKSNFVRFGADIDFFSSEKLEKARSEEEYIICVGYSKRDWKTLVDAYCQIDTSVKLRLVGHVIHDLEEIQGIEQIPFVPIRELINQISHAIFCVLPLEKFNYSYGQMTLMQQMALEKCVITARVPSLVDYVQEGKTAIMYEAGNVEDLCYKIKDCLTRREYVKTIGKNAREYLEVHCNEKKMADELEILYIQLLGEKVYGNT